MGLFSSFFDALNKGSNSTSNKTSSSSSGAGRYTSNNQYASQTQALVNSNKNTGSTTSTSSNKTSSSSTPTYGPIATNTTPTTNYIPGTNIAVNNSTKVPTNSEIVNGIITGNLVANNTPDWSTGLLSRDPVGTTASNILSSGSIVNQQPWQQNTVPVPTTTTPTNPTNNTSNRPTSNPTPSNPTNNDTNDDPIDDPIDDTDDWNYGYMGGSSGYSGGGGGSSTPSWLDTINQMYDAKKQQAIAAIQNAMDNAIAGYEASIDNLPEQYDPLRRQSEVERYKSSQALRESLANSGNTYSGMGRQDTLNMQNAYANRINELNMSEQNEMEELQRLIEQTRRDGEFQKANAGYDFDIAAYQAALNQASEDRAYEWQKYLQDYQEKQDALDREFNYQKYYNSLANNYTPSTSTSSSSNSGYKPSTPSVSTGTTSTGVSSNSNYQLSGTTAQKIANYNTKSAVNEAVNNLQMEGVNDTNAEYAEELIKAYYIKNGKYPTTENIETFVAELNELKGLGRTFSEEDIANYAARMNFTPYETILAYIIYGGN